MKTTDAIIKSILEEELQKNEHFLEGYADPAYPVTIKAKARVKAIREYFKSKGYIEL